MPPTSDRTERPSIGPPLDLLPSHTQRQVSPREGTVHTNPGPPDPASRTCGVHLEFNEGRAGAEINSGVTRRWTTLPLLQSLDQPHLPRLGIILELHAVGRGWEGRQIVRRQLIGVCFFAWWEPARSEGDVPGENGLERCPGGSAAACGSRPGWHPQRGRTDRCPTHRAPESPPRPHWSTEASRGTHSVALGGSLAPGAPGESWPMSAWEVVAHPDQLRSQSATP